ncbi:MAG: hypothetical protein KDA96_15170 [Planctomycetaceae bacterium]|nr:hypothetical protein [Planctomycetaceae bacterium]
MPVFQFEFEVKAPLQVVSAFHFQPGILKTLCPPPTRMQVHSFEPLSDGSVAEFTLWLGPIPVYWKAVHSDVSVHGFTDTQTQGPMKRWVHTHTFQPVSDHVTRVCEHIEFDHHSGLRGLWSRLLFPRPALLLLFSFRRRVTQRICGVFRGSPDAADTEMHRHAT